MVALAAAGLILAQAGSVSMRCVPDRLPPIVAGKPVQVCVIARNGSAAAVQSQLNLRVPKGVSVDPESKAVRLGAGESEAYCFSIRADATASQPFKVQAKLGKQSASLDVGGAFDLSAAAWRAKLDSERKGIEQGWTGPEFDDSGWDLVHIPYLTISLGVTYMRARVVVPESWRGKALHLKFAAVDDNDITYFNGVEVGRTGGWAEPRDYVIPEKLIRSGEENLICVAVDNIHAGGGIFRAPNTFGPESPQPKQGSSRLHPAGPIGEPLPFRKMHVEDGVLRYPDDKEVCLFGVNYYPQSWQQYENMRKITKDMKSAIRRDMDEMKAMGVEVIRVHIFDTEISDHDGYLLTNEHLDLLDYAVSEAQKRGIYYMFTLIAWWASPGQNPDSFSVRTPKEAMWFADSAVSAQERYVKALLNHRNPYTGRRYAADPGICALEIMNEPGYWDYNQMMDDKGAIASGTSPEHAAPFKAELRQKWLAWCKAHECEPEPQVFPAFRYMLFGGYLSKLHQAIRSTGAEQPVAAALCLTTGIDDLTQAIADSPCEAVTFGDYAGGWDRWAKGSNYLNYADNATLDPRLDGKARLVYEWDCIRTLDSYMYPAITRRHRSEGAQISACFQYDSSVTAPYNSDWPQHYLNLVYTPSKAIGMRIAREAFHALPRGAAYPTPPDDQVFGSFAVSFGHNISLMSTAEMWANAEPVRDWQPMAIPKRPKTIVGVGNSPFAAYDGTGAYEVTVGEQSAELLVRPDVVYVRDPLASDAAVDKLAAELRYEPRQFRLRYPGVEIKKVTRLDDGKSVAVQDNAFEVNPGVYRLDW